MRLELTGASYVDRSFQVTNQRTVNWYTEKVPDGRIVLLPTPGLKFAALVGTGPHRGSIVYKDKLYVVSGTKLYSVDQVNTVVEIGTLNTQNGRVSMSSNGTQLMIVDGTDGWLYDGTNFTHIVDTDFVDAVQVVFMDGYFIVNKPGTGEFYISGLYDGTAWDPLDFATAEIDPDNLIALMPMHQYLFLLGDTTTEAYWDAGAADFPFERVQGGFFEWGTAAPFSVTKMGDSILWLTKNEQGKGLVIQTTGFNPKIISNASLHSAIESYGHIADAFGYSFTISGHPFYVLTFPSADKTWLYDSSADSPETAWTELEGYGIGRHRSNTYAYFNNSHYVGDYENGNLYTLDLNTYTDNGEPIIRKRTTSIVHGQGHKIRWSRLEIQFEQGVGLLSGQGSDPSVMLRWSDDGGRTFSNAHTRPTGKLGHYMDRTVWRNMGASYNRMFEISVSDPIKWVLIDGFIEVDILNGHYFVYKTSSSPK